MIIILISVFAYYEIAASVRNEKALKTRDKLQKKMSPDQIEKAQELSLELLKTEGSTSKELKPAIVNSINNNQTQKSSEILGRFTILIIFMIGVFISPLVMSWLPIPFVPWYQNNISFFIVIITGVLVSLTAKERRQAFTIIYRVFLFLLVVILTFLFFIFANEYATVNTNQSGSSSLPSQNTLKYYTKRAERGDVAAQLQLGMMYSKGEGVPQDYKKAFEWYEMAAIRGDAEAQYNLSIMYANGRGVLPDQKKAFGWGELAKQGSETKPGNLKSIIGVPAEPFMFNIINLLWWLEMKDKPTPWEYPDIQDV